MNKTVFIIDTYNPFSPQNINVCSIFWLNGKQWCIREVECEWGKPKIGISFEDNAPEPEDFLLYNTYEEALMFVNKLKQINR